MSKVLSVLSFSEMKKLKLRDMESKPSDRAGVKKGAGNDKKTKSYCHPPLCRRVLSLGEEPGWL